MIAVIDINISNIGSVMEAFQRIGLKTHLTSAAADVTKADAIILPGVGSFRDGMARLGELGLVEPLRSAASAGKPIFGICLGMQLMAETGEEFGTHKGLGLLPGSVVRLPEEPTVRIPNIGWCDVEPTRNSTLFPEDAPKRSFYFVHSYHLLPSDPKVTSAVVKTGKSDIVAAIEHKNLSAVQFHPEKSQDAGLDLLGRLAAKLGAFA